MPQPGNPALDAAAAPAAPKLARVAVFCGSRSGSRPAYAAAAETLGREMARRRMGLTYGGGTVGLMGVIARAVHDAYAAQGGGGPSHPVPVPVLGFIPELLSPAEASGEPLGETRIVPDMHARKAAMAAHADAFVAMPGGFGTLEEIFEALTWQTLGFHGKPVALLDTEGFYGGLRAQVARMVDDGLLKREVAAQLVVASDPVELLDALEAWRPPAKSALELAIDERRLASSGVAVGIDVSRPSGEAE